ncbi:MAG: hypothetical protein RL491_718 [Bacteroidota bacterium]
MKLVKSALLRFVFIILLISTLHIFTHAQVPSARKTYWRSATEFIFSFSDVQGRTANDSIQDLTAALRFSGFFNFQYQYHYDFSRTVGFMAGFGVRNVGFINSIGDSIKLKQRVYSFGVPLALKVGRLPDDFTLSAGVEPELFFHYKQKAFYDDEKYRKMGWFSDRVNLINPSVFLEVRFKSNSFIRCKYYLSDVLVDGKQSVTLGEKSVYYNPSTSKMFYVSIGVSVLEQPRKKNPDERKVFSIR